MRMPCIFSRQSRQLDQLPYPLTGPSSVDNSQPSRRIHIIVRSKMTKSSSPSRAVTGVNRVDAHVSISHKKINEMIADLLMLLPGRLSPSRWGTGVSDVPLY